MPRRSSPASRAEYPAGSNVGICLGRRTGTEDRKVLETVGQGNPDRDRIAGKSRPAQRDRALTGHQSCSG